jgi:hypothetical protein
MRNISYDTFNTVLNLGSLFVALVIYVIRVIAQFLIIWPLYKMKCISGTWNRKLFNQVFFYNVLAIFTEGYFEFLLSARLFFEAPEDSFDNTPLIRNLSWAFLVICLVVTPALYSSLMLYDLKYLGKSKSLKRRLGPLFTDIDLKSKINLMHNHLFLVRRIIFIELAFRLKHLPC